MVELGSGLVYDYNQLSSVKMEELSSIHIEARMQTIYQNFNSLVNFSQGDLMMYLVSSKLDRIVNTEGDIRYIEYSQDSLPVLHDGHNNYISINQIAPVIYRRYESEILHFIDGWNRQKRRKKKINVFLQDEKFRIL